MILQVLPKDALFDDTSTVMTQVMTIPKGVGYEGASIVYAYFNSDDEQTPLYAYAYGTLGKRTAIEHPHIETWVPHVIRPFVAEQLLHPKISAYIGYQEHTFTLDATVAMYVQRALCDNQALELELAYHVLSPDVSFSKLHVAHFQMNDQQRRMDFLHQAYKGRKRILEAQHKRTMWTDERAPIDLTDLLQMIDAPDDQHDDWPPLLDDE